MYVVADLVVPAKTEQKKIIRRSSGALALMWLWRRIGVVNVGYWVSPKFRAPVRRWIRSGGWRMMAVAGLLGLFVGINGGSSEWRKETGGRAAAWWLLDFERNT
ncbi:hypothetical protein RND71_022102 [Anisodus tanguticus]|uniref:Uncharacterized protein n=1 Tax=Anisodus tanguticus TaxID=243964 RepID=A0AAE1V7X6_9SOLA|nr:hypothetical protein RND71_022102 [Anisodus tanguticus]